MTVHRKDKKKQNSKRKSLFSIVSHFLKDLSQRSYQWGTQEGYGKKSQNNFR